MNSDSKKQLLSLGILEQSQSSLCNDLQSLLKQFDQIEDYFQQFESQFEKKYKVVLSKYNKNYSEIKNSFDNLKQNLAIHNEKHQKFWTNIQEFCTGITQSENDLCERIKLFSPAHDNSAYVDNQKVGAITRSLDNISDILSTEKPLGKVRELKVFPDTVQLPKKQIRFFKSEIFNPAFKLMNSYKIKKKNIKMHMLNLRQENMGEVIIQIMERPNNLKILQIIIENEILNQFDIMGSLFQRTLSVLLRKEKIQIKSKFRMCMQICEAVDFQHKKDPPKLYLHINPENILVDKKFNAYLLQQNLFPKISIYGFCLFFYQLISFQMKQS